MHDEEIKRETAVSEQELASKIFDLNRNNAQLFIGNLVGGPERVADLIVQQELERRMVSGNESQEVAQAIAFQDFQLMTIVEKRRFLRSCIGVVVIHGAPGDFRGTPKEAAAALFASTLRAVALEDSVNRGIRRRQIVLSSERIRCDPKSPLHNFGELRNYDEQAGNFVSAGSDYR